MVSRREKFQHKTTPLFDNVEHCFEYLSVFITSRFHRKNAKLRRDQQKNYYFFFLITRTIYAGEKFYFTIARISAVLSYFVRHDGSVDDVIEK